MKRTIKNTVMIVLVCVLAGASFLTWNISSLGSSPPMMNSQSSMGAPPDMQNGSGQSGFTPDNNQSNQDNQNSQDNQNNQNGQSGSSQNSNNQPPQMNGNSDNSSDNNSGNSQGGFVPDNNQNGQSGQGGSNQNSNNQPPQMNGNSGNSSDNNSGNSQGGFVPDNNQNGQNGQGGSNQNSNNQPPQMNGNSGNSSDNNSGNSQGGFVPDNNQNGQSGSNQNKQNGNGFKGQNGMPQMNGGRDDFKHGGLFFLGGIGETVKYIAFGTESLFISILVIYLIMSRFNKYGLRETFANSRRILIYVLCALVLASTLTCGQIVASQALCQTNAPQLQSQSNQNSMPNAQGQNQSSSVEASGKTTVTDTKTLSESYSSTTSDESSILVQNGGNATIDGASIDKSGDSSNTENSEFYGVNAAVLVKEKSTATIKNATIKTSAKGGNAVFATGEDAKIYISDSTITSTGTSSARGLDATYGGYIEADNVKITTKGGSCATLATDRGEGTVKVKNSELETNGAGSPVIYSTGDISITKTTGTANGAQMAVIEGKNSATVTSSTLTASGAGNRGDVDVCGVMIYQSMSGDASEGKGTFTAKDSSLSINKNSSYYKTAPMFFVTNTDAEINLTNTKLSFGSSTLLSVKGTDQWGNSGSNGGNVTLNAKSQKLSGNIELDKISTLTMNLTSSTYEGTINGDNTAKSVTLKLDKNSKIKLTGNSYVTELDDADSDYSNIDFNGYKLYVNGKAVN